MKQYIFLLNNVTDTKEVKIEADGMLDALSQAKELVKKVMKETSEKIDIKFKGTVYLS
ncbi:hypothetical protein [Aquibacillus kalidii]|uniref:hypothetical protein n=1 Tax=Aquibacillus kalidii TaxID=2762597 RepID=UPI0016494B3B|nr:hypothetical protein [Aquibacillus kalidii]